ncbi:hypothetical protein KTE13_30285, partial [Burkholderia multivorans]|uniref:hypothetical protein n=1 Tax=Burkholderia multivorans TaxID=87883 RepID=UPI001C22FA67
IDQDKMRALAAELRANHEAMKSWMPTHQLESSPASKGADAIDTLLAALEVSDQKRKEAVLDAEKAREERNRGQVKINAEWIRRTAELRAALEAAAAFVQDVSKQKPERPDYWSSCSQCEHNIDRAQDLLEKQAALSQRQEES